MTALPTIEDAEMHAYETMGYTGGTIDDYRRLFYLDNTIDPVGVDRTTLTNADLEVLLLQQAFHVTTMSADDMWYAFLSMIYGPDLTIYDLKYAFYSSI